MQVAGIDKPTIHDLHMDRLQADNPRVPEQNPS
jgi:hypothetical protein